MNKFLQTVLGLGLLLGTFQGAEAAESYKQMFTITGYYSPLPNQNYYVTGDYAAEIRLNGKGTHAADGTPVYPGMIAAPGNFAYGTKICLPNFGCGKIHDRGQAIVEKGERDLARHTRLDVWLGYGEEGLARALTWGVKQYEGEVFSPDSDVEVSVNFKVPLAIAQILDVPARQGFVSNMRLGSESEDVRRLKEYLTKLGWYEGEINTVFDESLKTSVIRFQLHNALIANSSESVAGLVGPKTRSLVSDHYYDLMVQDKLSDTWNEFHFDTPVRKGQRSADVFKLQQLLLEEEHLEVFPTGFFGPKTAAALTEFQIAQGLIPHANTLGSGTMGPNTTKRINELLAEKAEEKIVSREAAHTYVQVRDTFRAWAGISTTQLYAQK